MKLIAYGDSITRGYGVGEREGWAALLPSLLDIEVVNAGGNGNTSSEGLARFNADVLPHLPAAVMVEFGGNDAVEGHRHVDPLSFERNIQEIHRRIVARGGTTILSTFPPIIDEKHCFGKSAFHMNWGGLDKCVERYRMGIRKLAKNLNIPLFNMDELLRPELASGQELLLADGIHLSAKGNILVAKALAGFLKKHL